MAKNIKKLVDLLDDEKYSNKKKYRRVDDINSQDKNILDSYMRSRVNKKRTTQTKDDSNIFYSKFLEKQSSFLKSFLKNINEIKNSILDLVKIEKSNILSIAVETEQLSKISENVIAIKDSLLPNIVKEKDSTGTKDSLLPNIVKEKDSTGTKDSLLPNIVKEKDSTELSKISENVIAIKDSLLPNIVKEKDSTKNFYLKIITEESSNFKNIAKSVDGVNRNILELLQLEQKSQDDEFFMRQKERENLLEEQRKKATRKDAKFAISPTSEQTKDSDKKTIFESLDESFKLFKNIILKIVGIFGAIFSGLRKLFSSKNFGKFFKIFGRIFIVLSTIYSLFESLSKAYQTYKETGSIKESILTFFGSFIESITMGLFTEDSVKNFFNNIGNFLGPIIDSIKETFNHVKDCLSEMISNVWNWVVNNFGIPKISLPSIKNPFTGTEYNLGSIGPYYPLKDNPKSVEDQQVVKKEKTTTQDITEAPKELNTKKLKSTLKRYNQSWESEKSKLDPNAPDYEKKLAKINKKWQGKTESVQKEINKIEGITETQNAVNIQTQSTPTANIDASVNPSIDVSSKQTSMSATPAATSVTSSSIATPSIDINANYTSNSTSAPVQSVKSPAESTSTPTSVQSATPVAVSKPMSTVGRSSISNHVSPKDITPAPMQDKPLTSGSELSTSSTQIAESQRMESAADQGTIINSPTNNITKTTQDKSEQSVADVYDTDFMAYLIST